jgi:hypothetical protein
MKIIFIEVVQDFSVLIIVMLLDPKEIGADIGHKLHVKL